MSPSAENSTLIRAGVIGAACGLTLVAFAYGVVRAIADHLYGDDLSDEDLSWWFRTEDS